jgi:hypothetical protein
MKLRTLYTAVAGALALGGGSAALAQQYYVLQPAASEAVVVQERITPAPAQTAVVVPGERITMSYTVDDAYPFPSPETHVTQSGVFVPDQPRTVETIPAQPRAADPGPFHRRNPMAD